MQTVLNVVMTVFEGDCSVKGVQFPFASNAWCQVMNDNVSNATKLQKCNQPCAL